ncbi:MAG: XdhC family protein [Sedimentisphaerales bacterium]
MIDKTESSPEVLLKIEELIEGDENFAIALVLKAEGSTPRKAGVRAIVLNTGKIFGTLGGGVVEAQTQSRAVQACKSKKPVVFDLQLYGADRQDDVPICGGSMTVLVDPNAAKDKESFKKVSDAVKNRIKGVLITTINETQDLYVDYQWFSEDSIPSDEHFPRFDKISYCLKHEAAQLFTGSSDNKAERKDVFIEPIIPRPLLVIVGGGHIGQALAFQGNFAGFDIIVLDDRPEFTNPELFPCQSRTICGDIAKELGKINADKDTYIVIVTRGHKNDAEALEVSLKKSAAYVGMIGSRRKVALIRENFIQTALCTEEEFDKIFTPIGLDIGAVTVPEIAVSIIAELIAVRRKGLVHKAGNQVVSK